MLIDKHSAIHRAMVAAADLMLALEGDEVEELQVGQMEE